jgi:hypothetical protein
MMEGRASGKCAMLLVIVGFCMCILALEQFIHNLSDIVVLFEALRGLFWGVLMVMLGLLIFNYNRNKGMFDPMHQELG